ncbi:hypothetical protein YC2023_041090 [Brassica napus]
MDEMGHHGNDHDGGVEKVQAPVCWSSRDVLSLEGGGGSDISPPTFIIPIFLLYYGLIDAQPQECTTQALSYQLT